MSANNTSGNDPFIGYQDKSSIQTWQTWAEAQAQALKGRETELDMSGKAINAHDAIMLALAISDAIPAMGSLTSLDISSNSLAGNTDGPGRWISDATGIKALAAAISECK